MEVVHYEQRHHFFTASFCADGFDCIRDDFIGQWRDESHPVVVVKGECTSSQGNCVNHCAVLMKRFTLAPGGSVRFHFLLGPGDRNVGRRVREKYQESRGIASCIG